MNEQTKAIEKNVRIELNTKIPDRIKLIKEWLMNHCTQWREELMDSFEKLFQMEKKEASYLQICFLRTSLLTEQYFYRAYLYDSLYYLDQKQVWIDVDTMFVYQFFQEDLQEIKQTLQKMYKHLYPYDIMRIKEICNFYYIGLMKMCIDSILPDLLKTKAYTELKKTENFKILFGEYMGKAEVIYGVFHSGTR